uniref:Uncharacterized protein n=1 Tax=Romanomermis culicivorax TaxID=13658 RepID=A0A915JAA4_ROMCU
MIDIGTTWNFLIKSVSQAKTCITVIFEWIVTPDQMTRDNLIFSAKFYRVDGKNILLDHLGKKNKKGNRNNKA